MHTEPSATPWPAPSIGQQVGRLARLARKEITEILRDRRTIVTLILMPLLLYPLLALAFYPLLQSTKLADTPPSYRLGFRSEVEKDRILGFLLDGLRSLEELAPDARDKDRAVAAGEPGIEALVIQDLEAAARSGKVDVAILPRQELRLHPQRFASVAADVELIYRQDSPYARGAVEYLDRLCTAANADLMHRQLQTMGIDQRAAPVRMQFRPLHDPNTKKNSMFPVLIPLVLILMTITGAVYPAIDLTAGERERGTLEILIAAPIPRLGLLLAKYVTVLTVAMLTALVNIGTMIVTLLVTLLVTGNEEKVFGTDGLSPLVVVEVFGLMLLFAAFFSGVLLALTSFARSFKEAQAYLVPLMLVSLAPGLLALSPQLELNGPLALVPLLNIVLLARDLLQDQAHLLTAVVVVASTAAYALGTLALAARIFGAEAVLYSESTSWRSWFRRSDKQR